MDDPLTEVLTFVSNDVEHLARGCIGIKSSQSSTYAASSSSSTRGCLSGLPVGPAVQSPKDAERDTSGSSPFSSIMACVSSSQRKGKARKRPTPSSLSAHAVWQHNIGNGEGKGERGGLEAAPVPRHEVKDRLAHLIRMTPDGGSWGGAPLHADQEDEGNGGCGLARREQEGATSSGQRRNKAGAGLGAGVGAGDREGGDMEV